MNRRGARSVPLGMHTHCASVPTLRRSSRPRRAGALVAGLTLVVALAACGSDDDPDTEAGGTTSAPSTEPAGDDYGGTGGGTDGAEAAAGTIVAEDFSLTDLTVAPGEEIVLENAGGAPHTATADEGAFDLGQVAGGETSDPVAAPDEPGAYPFHCEIHPDMTATLTVEG